MRFPFFAALHAALPAILASLALLPAGAAEERNYLLFPVTTEYQRQVSPGGNYSVYGVVNAAAFVRDGKFDQESAELPVFRRELATLSAKHPGPAIVYFLWLSDFPASELRTSLEMGFKEQAKEAGVERCGVGSTFSNGGDAWGDRVNRLEAEKLDASAAEPAVREGGVTVFPIRTPLSSWITDGASCVARIQQPFDRNTTAVTAADRQSLAKCIAQLPEHTRFKLQFVVQSTTAGRDHVDRFVEPRIDDPESAIFLAQDLGYATSTVTHSPCGGDPESLLLQTAPDIELSMANGEKFRFENQRADRVTLLTFWGIACGPCRVEIPHLKKLQANLGERGFQVVAVNAYNESPEEVAKFAQANQLNYTVLVQGKSVARETYKVGAYPTAFLIDRKGRVVNYFLGFDEGDEAGLEARIRELLPVR
jgi:thiol-disulfide isomerase/thioredoxin